MTMPKKVTKINLRITTKPNVHSSDLEKKKTPINLRKSYIYSCVHKIDIICGGQTDAWGKII